MPHDPQEGLWRALWVYLPIRHQSHSALWGRAGADAFAANVLPVVRDLQDAGVVTVRAIAEALNLRGILMVRWRLARF